MKTIAFALQDDDIAVMLSAFGAFEGVSATDVQREAMRRSGNALLDKLAERGLVLVARPAYPTGLTEKERRDLDEAPVRHRTQRRCARWLLDQAGRAFGRWGREVDSIAMAGHQSTSMILTAAANELVRIDNLPEQEL